MVLPTLILLPVIRQTQFCRFIFFSPNLHFYNLLHLVVFFLNYCFVVNHKNIFATALSMIARINNYIQRRLQEENLESIPLKKVADWLAEEGILSNVESNPDFSMRRHIYRGNIFGAVKENGWRIHRLPYYEEILDPVDLRGIFGLKSRTSVYRKIRKERIPYIRYRKKGIYFKITDLLKWAVEKKDDKSYREIQKKYQEIKGTVNPIRSEVIKADK